jgi:hypothetical protein
MKRLLAVVVAASLLATLACALGPGANAYGDGAEPAARRVVVNVTNYTGSLMVVSAVGSGTVYRMGIVNPGMVGRFVLRPAMLASGGMVEFVAQPAGNEPPIWSGRLLIRQGNVVDFRVTMHLADSYATVRP